jgi:hypothetical protein
MVSLVALTIKFVSNRPWLNKDSVSKPEPIIKSIPDWYRKADRFAKKPDGEYWENPGGGKMPTWKACPAIFDIMGTGYMLKTPCDIEFVQGDFGSISVKISDKKYQDFCSPRPPMPQFRHPDGYHENHFAWFPDWAVETPEGYSVLYSQPFNRFELPFLTTSGIIDNDKVNLPGSMPFFLVKGFSGILPAGTPYAQMLPFKREDWQSESVIEKSSLLQKKNESNSAKYRKPDGGIYKNEVWSKRTYS